MANKETDLEASVPPQESPRPETEPDEAAMPVEENDNDERAECDDPVKSNEEIEDEEPDQKEDHSENAEKDPSTFPATADAEEPNKMGSESDGGKDGKKEKKNKMKRKRNKMRKNKRKGSGAGTKSGSAEGASEDDGENKEIKGLIFMCSAKTKKDCFDYKIFGLPESKKDTVCKIYKGMKLFLYDIDLKLLYGIYRAAGPGGYNIEPKAFKSAFPSQVRFAVVEDCVPLSEDHLKKAITYHSKNKFDCQLSGEQVQKLVKLFRNVNKQSAQKRKAENRNQGSAKRFRKSGYGHRTVRDHYRGNTHGRRTPPPSHYPPPRYAAPPPPPLPAYDYGDVDYYGREVPIEGYARDPYGYYRDPPPYRGYPRSSAQYHAPPPRYRYGY